MEFEVLADDSDLEHVCLEHVYCAHTVASTAVEGREGCVCFI